MKRLTYLLLVVFALVAFSAHAQKKKANKQVVNDTAFQAMKLEWARRAAEKRVLFFEELPLLKSDSVQLLDMSHLDLEQIPEVHRFDKLKVLKVNNNKLKTVGDKAFLNDSLQIIDLSFNALEQAIFSVNLSVCSLNLSHNKLKRIPRSVRKLKHLRTLDLENNQIKRIPRFIKHLDSLNELVLNYNQIKLNRRAARRLAKIELLQIGGNKLASLPKNFGVMKGVKKLNLGKNQLTDLPQSFGEMEQLTNVIFYENHFERMPEVLFKLTRLTEVDFYHNRLTEIPDGIGKLSQLKQLFVAFNQIAQLPYTIRNLNQLRYLYAHHNQIGHFPLWIADMPLLERADLSYNKILRMPDLSKMPALTELDMQENMLEYFPWELLEKPNMRLLILKNNPFILTAEETKMLKDWQKGLDKDGLIVVY